MPLRVLLAEDETLVREGLRLLLEGDFRVVGAVADAASLCAQTRRLRPDVVVARLRGGGPPAPARGREGGPCVFMNDCHS